MSNENMTSFYQIIFVKSHNRKKIKNKHLANVKRKYNDLLPNYFCQKEIIGKKIKTKP